MCTLSACQTVNAHSRAVNTPFSSSSLFIPIKTACHRRQKPSIYDTLSSYQDWYVCNVRSVCRPLWPDRTHIHTCIMHTGILLFIFRTENYIYKMYMQIITCMIKRYCWWYKLCVQRWRCCCDQFRIWWCRRIDGIAAFAFRKFTASHLLLLLLYIMQCKNVAQHIQCFSYAMNHFPSGVNWRCLCITATLTLSGAECVKVRYVYAAFLCIFFFCMFWKYLYVSNVFVVFSLSDVV